MSDIIPSEHPLDRFLRGDHALHVAADGQILVGQRIPAPRVLLPGSFNPIHRGHWELARIAEQIVGMAVAFEISVANVDKPPLSRSEIVGRLTQFNWQASVWLTHAPTFARKAELFPGATFIVGADTALRIVSPRYYGDDDAMLLQALEQIRILGCRFLVACRVDARGQCLRGGDLPVPPEFRELFTEIAPEQFRWDISSTALRGAGS